MTAFIFLRRISLGHQEESFATPGKCNVDTSLCDRCQDSDQRRSFTWMEYWDPSASYCDTVLGQGLRISIQQHFVNLASRDTQSFRHPFMASQLNSHYSPTLLSFSIQAQSLSGSVHPKGLSRGTFVKGAHSNLDSHHRDCQDPKWPWGDWARQCWVPCKIVQQQQYNNNQQRTSGRSTANCNQRVFLSLIRSCPQIRRSEIEIAKCFFIHFIC